MDFAKLIPIGMGLVGMRRPERETRDMGEIILNYEHLGKWIEQAEDIRVSRGTSHAMSYLIGEKLFNMVSLCQTFREEIGAGSSNLTRPASAAGHELRQDMEPVEIHEYNRRVLAELEDMLTNFAALVNTAFEPYMIRGYFAAALCSAESRDRLSDHLHHVCGEMPGSPHAVWEEVKQRLSR